MGSRLQSLPYSHLLLIATCHQRSSPERRAADRLEVGGSFPGNETRDAVAKVHAPPAAGLMLAPDRLALGLAQPSRTLVGLTCHRNRPFYVNLNWDITATPGHFTRSFRRPT